MRFLPEMPYLAVSIIDRFLSVHVVSLLLTYILLVLGACFLDHGTTCSQLPLLC